MYSRCRNLAVVVAILVFAAFLPASAQAGEEAGEFVKELGDSAIRLLTSNGLADAERETRFRALFRTKFDVERIGRFTLGKHVRRADEKQLAEFLRLFEDFIVVTCIACIRGSPNIPVNLSRFVRYGPSLVAIRSC